MKPNGNGSVNGTKASVFDRMPPQSLDAERSVIGSLLLSADLLEDVAAVVKPEDFYADAHRRVFSHLLKLRDRGGVFDAVTVAESLKAAGELEAAGGLAYVAELVASVPVAAHATHHAEIVREKAARRNIIHAASAVLHDAYDPYRPVDELLNAMEAATLAIATGRYVRQAKPVSVAVEKVLEKIAAILERRFYPGVKTGFRQFDTDFGGLFAGELVILAARPGIGKSALAAQVARHVAKRGQVYFASLEMADEELAQRLMCERIDLDARFIRQGRIEAGDRESMVDAANELAATGLHIDDRPDVTVMDIRRECRRLKRKGLALAVVDYLQLIKPDNPRADRHLQVGESTRALKNMARELEVPVLCLAQLNRQAEKEERPALNHLRESGSIEQDADTVMFLYRERPKKRKDQDDFDQDDKPPFCTEWIVAKSRNNSVGTVTLDWWPMFTRFADRDVGFEDFAGYSGEEEIQ